MAIEPKDLRGSAATNAAATNAAATNAAATNATASKDQFGNANRVPRDLPRQVNAPQKPKKRGRVWRGIGIGVLLTACGLGAYGTLTPHGRTTVAAITTGVKMVSTMREHPDLIFTQAGSDHVNILLIGRDVNWIQQKVYDPKTKTYRMFHVADKETAARSDTMIVMSLDKTRNTIRMVSLPRDAIVHLPPNKYGEREGKLNAAHAFGGPPLLMRTLHDELGLTIHHYAVIKFEGFKNLIDQVGGVDVNVRGALKRDRRTGKNYYGNLDYDDKWGNLHIHLKPGMQHLDGQQAHNYVRFRMDEEGDPSRIRRQQDVMRALAKKIMHSSPLEIPGLVKEMRRQFETDLTDEMMGSAAQFARGLNDSAKIQPLTLFGVYGTRGSLTLNKRKNEKLLAAIFGSTFNPDRFLRHSPTTDDDEIGAANDSNPAAQEVLREAGLLKGRDAVVAPPEASAPTRVEPSPADSSSDDSSTRASIRRARDERRSQAPRHVRPTSDASLAPSVDSASPPADLGVDTSQSTEAASTASVATPDATSSKTASSGSDIVATPRRKRHRRRREVAARSTATSSGSSEDRGSQTLGGSPVPIPEREVHSLSVEESPVPQPER